MTWDPPKPPEPLPAGQALVARGQPRIGRRETVVLIVMLVIIGLIVLGSLPDDGTAGDAGTDAVVACQLAVEDVLKAPSTADHPRLSTVNPVKRSDGSWRVVSYVDAENSFGAMIRTGYTCTARKVSGGWRVDSLDVDD